MSQLDQMRLTVTLQRQHLATLPVRTSGWAFLVGAMALGAQPTVGPACRSHSTELAVLHHRFADPVDARVATDALVRHIDHDDLEILEGGILVHPVGVEHTKVASFTSSTLLSDTAKRATSLQVVDTSIARLPVDLTLVDRALATTTADTHTVHAVALLGLVSQATSLVGTSGPAGTMDGRQLPELPGADTLAETQHVGLLAIPKLTKVLVGSHV